jgi:hypothetical protein
MRSSRRGVPDGRTKGAKRVVAVDVTDVAIRSSAARCEPAVSRALDVD